MRISKLLAIAALILLLSQIPLTLWAEETSTLDPKVTPPTEGAPITQADGLYTGPPKISYYLSDENFIIMKVDGLKLGEVTGFTFDGIDITDLINKFQTDGSVEITSRDDGFNMTIKITNDQLPGKHKLGIIYGDNELSASMDSDKLTTEATASDGRYFGYLRVYGTVSEYKYGCYWNCWKPSRYATVDFWVLDGGYWEYVGATTTNSSGKFDVYIDGICGTVYVEASNNGKSGEATSSSVWSCGRSRTYVSVNPSIW